MMYNTNEIEITLSIGEKEKGGLHHSFFRACHFFRLSSHLWIIIMIISMMIPLKTEIPIEITTSIDDSPPSVMNGSKAT